MGLLVWFDLGLVFFWGGVGGAGYCLVRHPVGLLVYLRYSFLQNVHTRMTACMCMEICCMCGLRLQVFSQLGEISSTQIDLSSCICL